MTYVYEPGSYAPLARIDKREAANSERYSAGGGGASRPGSGATTGVQLYCFHTDTSGLTQEMSDAGGALRWRASYPDQG